MRPRCLRCGEGKAISEIQPICVECLWRIRGPGKTASEDGALIVAERLEEGVRLLVPKIDYLTGRWRHV